ncbi:hypothetical protein ACFOLJ_24465 [Rugamonas sp. CCM 8940]|uniref:hypothetical protein n=1 Tax=Rugamonas sp. CCM 8940 TaxID=2765359 RepID=UPI0018F62746|nr:hypothetical protein [Rugamonas sp. CCM 8940]MBJ7310470.1 hypothetical protein [Rugamonas sp. CCM 8940]
MRLKSQPLLLACLLLCDGARADDAGAAGGDTNWLGGFALLGRERTVLNATPLNQANFLDLAEHKTELAGLLEVRFQQFSWRARVETTHSDVAGQGQHTAFTLQELNRVFQLNDAVTLSLGKRLYALDPSYVNQPLGFFQKRSDLSDPLDSLGQSEGMPMAVLSWTGASASVAALYSRDARRHADGYNRGVEQSLLKFGYEFPQLSASIVLRRASGEANGVGASLSGAVGETLSWYGSAYSARGSQRPIVAGLLDADARLNPNTGASGEAGQGAYASLRANDGRRYHRATVGLVWTLPDLPKLQLEYAYDGRGLSDAQFGRLLALAKANRQSALPPQAIGGLQAQLAQLLVSQGARRRYLSVSLAQTVGEWELGGGVYLGQEDRSRVWHGTADYHFDTRTTLMISALHQAGAADSERALSPLGSSLALRLRRLF